MKRLKWEKLFKYGSNVLATPRRWFLICIHIKRYQSDMKLFSYLQVGLENLIYKWLE